MKIIAALPGIIREGLKKPGAPAEDGIVKAYITGGDVNNKGRFPNPRFFRDFLKMCTNQRKKNRSMA